jgi:hypothetical protein
MEVTMDATQAIVACAGCGATLADDQRYCLQCGAAQGDPRVAYRELIAPAVATPALEPALGVALPPVAAVPPAPPGPQRDWAPVIALGGLGALALVLVVGVLIGKSGTPSTPAAAPAPQVITIGGVAPAASDDGGADESDDAAAKDTGGDDADAVDTKAGAKAVQDLDDATGEDYQKKSRNLPDTVALPG